MKKSLLSILVVLLVTFLFTGCTKQTEKDYINHTLSNISKGEILEHKLSGKKCLVRNYGFRQDGVFKITDYDQIECRFEDETIEWVNKNEYKQIKE